MQVNKKAKKKTGEKIKISGNYFANKGEKLVTP